MGSVYATIARARGASSAGASILEALAKMRQQEEERKRAELQFQREKELAQLRNELALRNLAAQALLNAYGGAVTKGYIPPEQQQNIQDVIGGFLSGKAPVQAVPGALGEIAGATAAARQQEQKQHDIDIARQIAASAAKSVRPEEVGAFQQEVEPLVNAGDVAGVIAAAAKYGADENALKAEAQKAGIALTQAQTAATTEQARLTGVRADIAEATKDPVVREAWAKARLAEQDAKKAEVLFRDMVDRYRIENDILREDKELKRLLAEKSALEVKFERETQEDRKEELRKRNALLDAQIESTLAQASATKMRELLDKQEYDQNAQKFAFDLMERTQSMVAKTPKAAMEFIKRNKDLFDELGITADSFKEEAELVERMRRAQDPVTRNALDAIVQAMPNPPEGDIEAGLAKYRDMLKDTKLTDEEKEAWISTLRNAWWRVRQGLAVDWAKIAAQRNTSGVDKLDVLKEARAWLEEQRKALKQKEDNIIKEGEATGCVKRSSDPLNDVMLVSTKPECVKTLKDIQARLAALRARSSYIDYQSNYVGRELLRSVGIGTSPEMLKSMLEQQVLQMAEVNGGQITPEDVISIAKQLGIEMSYDDAVNFMNYIESRLPAPEPPEKPEAKPVPLFQRRAPGTKTIYLRGGAVPVQVPDWSGK